MNLKDASIREHLLMLRQSVARLGIEKMLRLDTGDRIRMVDELRIVIHNVEYVNIWCDAGCSVLVEELR